MLCFTADMISDRYYIYDTMRWMLAGPRAAWLPDGAQWTVHVFHVAH